MHIPTHAPKCPSLQCCQTGHTTFKDHFLAVLAGAAPSFPADRWDLLLPHAELTLNLLRSSRCNPAISAWHDLFGAFNFDATPLGPGGCSVHIHNKAMTRRSWDYRSHNGFYVGPALQHYRCYRVLNKESRAVAITDAVKFRHHYLPTPDLTAEDKIIDALQQLRLANRMPTAQLQAIYQLRDIFRHYASPTPTNDATHPRVHASTPRVPDAQPQPLVPPTALTPTSPLTTDEPGWQIVPTRTHTPPRATVSHPVASRTRSRLQATTTPSSNAFSVLTCDVEDNEDDAPTPVAMPVLDQDTGQSLEHRQLRRHPKYKDTWDTSYANELGRLCQGIGKDPRNPQLPRVAGTDTFKPIRYHDIPHQRKRDITYTRVVCELRPQKADPYRTRITLGGDRIHYPGDCGTKMGSLETVKLLLNSVLSTPNARFASFDISNFYLGTPLDRPEYVRIKLTDIPEEFSIEYALHNFSHENNIYFEVSKGVYGLKQAGKLANALLTIRLEAQGYYQCATTPGLWRHNWRPVMFILIVDDFGVQYTDIRHAKHLLQALQGHYTVTTDWAGKKFAGIDFTWDYTKRTCRLTMDT